MNGTKPRTKGEQLAWLTEQHYQMQGKVDRLERQVTRQGQAILVLGEILETAGKAIQEARDTIGRLAGR